MRTGGRGSTRGRYDLGEEEGAMGILWLRLLLLTTYLGEEKGAAVKLLGNDLGVHQQRLPARDRIVSIVMVSIAIVSIVIVSSACPPESASSCGMTPPSDLRRWAGRMDLSNVSQLAW